MLISLFAHVRDAYPTTVDVSWPDLCASMRPTAVDVPDKTALRAWSPTTFRGTRSNADAVAVSLAVADLDGVTDAQLADVLERTRAWSRLLYSTFSHGAKAGIRARLVVRLSRPVLAEEWQSWQPAWGALLGGYHDPAARDIARIYFGAFAPPERIDQAFSVELPGSPLDVDWLLRDARSRQVRADPALLEIVAKRIARKGSASDARWSGAISALARGEPFAAPGERDSAIFRIITILGRELPDVDPDSVIDAFAPSLAAMAALNSDTPTLEVVAEKVRRLLDERAAPAEVSRIAEAFGNGRTHPYSDHELATIAESIGCTVAELSMRWIVQRDKAFYLLFRDGYRGPFTAAEASNAALTWLSPAPISLHTVTASGAKTPKPPAQLVADYGTVADAIVLDMVARRTTYDATTRTVYEVAAVPRDLAPTYDHDVARWLELLGVPLAWIAAVTLVDRPCAALLVTGAKAAGKSLLANGLARIWTTGTPTALRNAAGKWGDALHRCPLTFADERIPEGITTEDIREFVQAHSRPIDRKFLPTSTLRGAARLIVAANNTSILALDEDLTENDVHAIAERFVHVIATHEPGVFLRSLPCGGSSFVTEDRLAKHALWLRDHHTWTPAGRFLVAGESDALFRTLLNTTGTRALILQWVVGWLAHPERAQGAARIDGGVWVTASTLNAMWSAYLSQRQPTAARIGDALRSVSDDERDGWRRISREAVRSWVQATEMVRWETIAERLG